MDGGERHISHIETPYDDDAEHHPGTRDYERYIPNVHPTGGPEDVDRAYNTRRLNTSYEPHEYHSQFPNTQISGGTPIQDVEIQYQQYNQGHGRQLSSQQPELYQNVQTYRPGSMLPPMQPPSSYQSLSPYQQRNAGAVHTVANQFEHTPYSGIPMSLPQTPPQVYHDPSSGYNIFQRSQRPRREHEQEQEESASQGDIERHQTILQTEQAQYEMHVRNAFQCIISNRLNESKDHLLSATRWLTASIVPLGLHHDQAELYEDRLVMWRQLNHCWEALGLKQHDLTRPSWRRPRTGYEVLEPDSLIDLVNQLVELCDQIEQYGLVDYEMGLWEEQIVGIFISCLDQVTSGMSSSTRQT